MTKSLQSESDLKSAYQGDSIARDYVDERFANELTAILHRTQIEVVNRRIEQLNPAIILEVAPGPGRLTRDIRTSHAHVCLEFNAGMIQEGKIHSPPGTAWVRGDAYHLPFGRDFDFVCVFRFLRHFRLADRERLYAELKRVIRPRGYLIFDAVNRRVSEPLRRADPDTYPIYDKLYSKSELRAELEANAFEIIDLRPVQKRFSWQYRSQVLLGPRSKRLNRGVIRALESLPWRDGLEWIVTCRLG